MDIVCARFEASWRNDEKPRIEDYLSLAPVETRHELLVELVKLDLHYRWQRAMKQPEREPAQTISVNDLPTLPRRPRAWFHFTARSSSRSPSSTTCETDEPGPQCSQCSRPRAHATAV